MNTWRRANTHALAPVEGDTERIDREGGMFGAGLIRGVVVAQAGSFKSLGRGAFNDDAIRQIASMMGEEEKGLKCRLSHPTESDDGVGNYLGRIDNPHVDTLTDHRGDEVLAVRGDLHLAESSTKSPQGNLADWLLTRVTEDPDSISSSLVLAAEEKQQLDDKKKPLEDENGVRLPSLWFPTKLHGSDLVDTGDAVDSLLSSDFTGLRNETLLKGCALLDTQFVNCDRDYVEQHLSDFVSRYLSHRFGDIEPTTADDANAETEAKLQRDALEIRSRNRRI